MENNNYPYNGPIGQNGQNESSVSKESNASNGQNGFVLYGGVGGVGGAANANRAYNTFDTAYYDNMARNRAQSDQNKKQDKQPKKPLGIKKFVMAAVMGIIFGLFAAGAYVGVTYPASKLMLNTAASEEIQAPVTSSKVIAEVEKEKSQTDKNTVEKNASETAIKSNKSDGSGAVVSDISGVVERVMPSVVSIYGEYQINGYYGKSLEEGSGSGIIISENDDELLIVTNYHVVQDSRSLSVSFIDGKQADAYIKGNDPDNDLAVISVFLKDLSSSTKSAISYAELGDSDSLRIGEPTIAIGNALGYGQSVTTGVVSAIQKGLDLGDGQSRTLIQTDAAINPGNSGGALFNINGEVIGINEMKKGGYVVEGMGYAIPITLAKPIIDDLSTKETKQKVPEAQRGYMGIYGVDVTEADAENFNLPVGVYITQVFEGYGAANAGLRRGDVITAVDKEEVSDFESLQEVLSYHRIGDVVKVKVSQGGDVNTIDVVLGQKMSD